MCDQPLVAAGDLGASLRPSRRVSKEVYSPTGTLGRSGRLSKREASLGAPACLPNASTPPASDRGSSDELTLDSE